MSPGLPRPGKVITIAMCVVGALWLAFTVGTHWAGVGPEAFALFCGNTERILQGQLWRVLTSPLLHDPTGFWHVFGVVLTLYFFGTPLEHSWGGPRLLRFLLAIVLSSAFVQVFFDVALPLTVRGYFANPYWFGGLGVSSALTVAWALNNRGSIVRLYGILPITPRVLIYMAVGSPALYLIFRTVPSEGIFSLLAGCAGGWLFGGSTPSPLRRYWLKLRLNRLDAEVTREAQQRKRRVERSNLKVIEGGRAKPGSNPGTDGEKGRGPDGRWLN